MINELLQHTLAASRQLVTLDDATINRILIDTASALLTRQAEVLAANVEDLSRMDPANPKYDRLKLTEERLAGIAGDMKNVASLPSPLGKLLSETTRPNGMVIRKMTVPFGVIGVIGNQISRVMFGIFGTMAYALPVLAFIAIAFGISNQGNRIATIKLIAGGVLTVFLSVLVELFAHGDAPFSGGDAVDGLFDPGAVSGKR